MRAGAGTDIDDVVRRAHRVLVVFDDDHRIPEIPEALQRIEELVVVLLMQADARLVKNVKDTGKARPDLCREPDPLRLAARERRRRPCKRKVA